jgi:hypothetical protein
MTLFLKIFFRSLAIISIIFFIYTFYKSEIYWSGTRKDYYSSYFLLFGFLILSLVIILYLKDIIKVYLFIIICCVTFSLYSFETYLTLQKINFEEEISNKKIEIYKKLSGKNFDTRNKFEFFKDSIKKNKNITLRVSPSFFLNENKNLSPFSGLSNSETINCNEMGYYAVYQSDRYGFNNPDAEWDLQKVEYLIVGDSFVHGACVNRPNDIGSVLRKLSNQPVLNLAYSNNGPLLEYATLREYLKPNVKNVLFVYYEGNDFNDLKRELSSEILLEYLKDLNFSQKLKSRQNEIDDMVRNKVIKNRNDSNIIKSKKNIFKIGFDFIRLSTSRGVFYNKKNSIPQLPSQFKEILKLAKDLSVNNNSNFYFIYLPTIARYLPLSKKDVNMYDESYISVKKIINELDIEFIDIHKEVFLKENNPLKFFPFSNKLLPLIDTKFHYNIDGYKRISDTIHKIISK